MSFKVTKIAQLSFIRANSPEEDAVCLDWYQDDGPVCLDNSSE
jgi:hypothetical protein